MGLYLGMQTWLAGGRRSACIYACLWGSSLMETALAPQNCTLGGGLVPTAACHLTAAGPWMATSWKAPSRLCGHRKAHSPPCGVCECLRCGAAPCCAASMRARVAVVCGWVPHANARLVSNTLATSSSPP